MSLNFPSSQIPFQRQVHLTDYLNIIKKRKWVSIGFFLGIVLIGTGISLYTTPVYKATTQIIIDRKYSPITEMANAVSADSRDDAVYNQTQCNLLMSRSLVKSVIENLKLCEPFDKSETTDSGSQDLPEKASQTEPEPVVQLDGQASNALQSSLESPIPSGMVDWYLSSLEIVPIQETHLVNISFLSESPDMAARIANTHARLFIIRTIQEQQSLSQHAINWLKEQIRDQKIKVGTSQRAMYEYKYEQLESFSINDEKIFSLPEIKQSSVIQDLRSKLAELKTKKSEMATKFGPKHPKMIEISSSIQQIERGIVDEIQTIRNVIKAELDQVVTLEKSIQQINNLPQQQGSFAHGEKAINYDMLNIDAESDREIYDILLKHAKEIGLTSNMEENNIRIVDEAEVPLFPVKPRVFVNIFLSVVLGLTFGVGLSFFLEYMDKTVRAPEDIMKRLGLSVLGVIPYDKSLKAGKTLALPPMDDSHHAQNELKEGYTRYDLSGSFISKLPLMQSGIDGQVFLIESATSGEGKTTVLAKSAISLAQGGLRVVMVDADLQHPSLHHLFGLRNGKRGGLINAMRGITSLEIHEGTLNKYSIDDLFSIIALKKQSGRLTVTSDAQTMTVIFEKGRFFHIQSQNVPVANRLGNMLLRGGFITENQLKDALERNQRTGQPLGYILINAGYINQSQLQGPLKLQMEECLQKLFSWKHGSFTFESGRIETYEDKRIYFEEDFTPIINRLGNMVGSRMLKNEIFSYVRTIVEPNLSLLPAGMGYIKSDGPIYFTLLSKFLDLLKQHYDVVLVDAPPLLDTGGSVTPILPLVDGVIFVVKSGYVSVEHINEATGYLKNARANIIGGILNQARIKYDSYSRKKIGSYDL